MPKEIFGGPSMEGPKVPSEARRREAPRRVGTGEGRRSGVPPQHGVLGAMPPENFSRINVEMAYCCLLKWSLL